MKTRFLCSLLFLLSSFALTQDQPSRWYKGNLHSHTINSDGDSPPANVMAWYKRSGYHFLAITDHNTFTDPNPLDSNPGDLFLLLGAEEITNKKAVHVNALGITSVIPPQDGSSVTEILRTTLAAVEQQGGVALINHPNFLWAFTVAEMLPLRGPFLLEIASGHPLVNHAGDGQTPSTEQMWDGLLSAGIEVYGAAVDDSHNFLGEFSMEHANPGRAWVVVRSPALTAQSLVASLKHGDFYSSTGVTLKDVRITAKDLIIDIAQPANDSRRYRVVFIGAGGKQLALSYENPALYRFTGNEGYVRARIEESNGRRAWTQPVKVGNR